MSQALMTFKCWVLDVEEAFHGEEERTTMSATTAESNTAITEKGTNAAKPSNKRPCAVGAKKPSGLGKQGQNVANSVSACI